MYVKEYNVLLRDIPYKLSSFSISISVSNNDMN